MNKSCSINIAVAGASEASADIASTSYEVGKLIAMQKWVLICGGHGTLSEIALGLKMGKPVFTLFSNYEIQGAITAKSAEDAISHIKELLG